MSPNAPLTNESGESEAKEAPETTVSSGQASIALQQLEHELARLQRSIRQAITEKLNQFAGQSMGSIEDNRKLVSAIAQLLDSHGLRVQCSECGHPAILRVSPRGNSTGVFVFDHTIDRRRTFHGGKSRMPTIRLVAKPRRQNAASAGASSQGKPEEKIA